MKTAKTAVAHFSVVATFVAMLTELNQKNQPNLDKIYPVEDKDKQEKEAEPTERVKFLHDLFREEGADTFGCYTKKVVEVFKKVILTPEEAKTFKPITNGNKTAGVIDKLFHECLGAIVVATRSSLGSAYTNVPVIITNFPSGNQVYIFNPAVNNWSWEYTIKDNFRLATDKEKEQFWATISGKNFRMFLNAGTYFHQSLHDMINKVLES